jgi:hypothetical protein
VGRPERLELSLFSWRANSYHDEIMSCCSLLDWRRTSWICRWKYRLFKCQIPFSISQVNNVLPWATHSLPLGFLEPFAHNWGHVAACLKPWFPWVSCYTAWSSL